MNGMGVIEAASLKTEIDSLYEQAMAANEKLDVILEFSFGPAPTQETKAEIPTELNRFVLCDEIANIRSKMAELNDKLGFVIERFGC